MHHQLEYIVGLINIYYLINGGVVAGVFMWYILSFQSPCHQQRPVFYIILFIGYYTFFLWWGFRCIVCFVISPISTTGILRPFYANSLVTSFRTMSVTHLDHPWMSVVSYPPYSWYLCILARHEKLPGLTHISSRLFCMGKGCLHIIPLLWSVCFCRCIFTRPKVGSCVFWDFANHMVSVCVWLCECFRSVGIACSHLLFVYQCCIYAVVRAYYCC